MAESYPNPNSEPGSHEGKDKKSGGKPEFNAPKHIEKSAGDTPLKFGDKILRAQPLGGEVFKPAEQRSSKSEEPPKQAEAIEHEPKEREDWRPVSAQELHERAVADQQARLEDMHMHERVAEVHKEPDGDDEDGTKKSKKSAADYSVAEKSQAGPEAEQPKPIEDILLPQETEVADGNADKAPAEIASQIGPDGEQNPDQPAGTEAAFQGIAQAPELAGLAAVELPEAASAAEATGNNPPASDDEVFRDMAENETGEDPGEAKLHEQAPGLPPVEVSSSEPEPFDQWLQGHPELTPLANTTNAAANSAPGHNGAPVPPSPGSPQGFNPNTPNQPPYGNGGGNQPPSPPSPNAGAWNNGPNVPPNPNVLNNPWAPAGNILNPATLAGISALEAQQQLNSLRHTAREAGLAGAVGILGLGLVIEHFRINKTRRMLKKQGKEQTKALSKTNKALEQEQYAHQATKTKLEHLDAAHNATSEQLRRTTTALSAPEHARAGSLTSAEKIAGVGLISAAAAAELAANAGHKLPTNEQLAKQLEHDKELGRAIKRNPELRDIAGLASSTAAEKGAFNRGVQEASANVQRQKRYEQLQTRGSNNGGGVQSGGADARNAPSLPAPQQLVGASSALTPAQRDKQAVNRPNIATNPWTWATVLFIIATVIMAIIIH